MRHRGQTAWLLSIRALRTVITSRLTGVTCVQRSSPAKALWTVHTQEQDTQSIKDTQTAQGSRRPGKAQGEREQQRCPEQHERNFQQEADEEPSTEIV